MPYAIKSHRLQAGGEPVPYRATPNKGGAITPSVIVLHDTAGRLEAETSVSWLCNKDAKASAHFVVGRDGEVTQLAPTNVLTWHAGSSRWGGRPNVNGFSVGIEIVNPGIMQRGAAGKARAWYGQEFALDEYGIEARATPEHGSGLWMPYTEAQIEAVAGICQALVAAYPITDITTHWAISPGRKVDTNPLFPLEAVRGRVFGQAVKPPPAAREEAPATIRRGAKGGAAMFLQSQLNAALGSRLTLDGDFGSQTETAVKEFQKRANLIPDGIVGPLTWEALDEAVS